MSDVPKTAESVPLEWARIAVHGPESEQYLQGQLTQDVTAVRDEGLWSLLLRPDSVVLSTCFVERDGEGFTLTLAHGLADVALPRLRRFHLRVDCTLELEGAVRGPFTTSADLVQARWPDANEFRAELTPRSYGTRLVGAAVSFTKGCYTGQELVGRLESRGSNVPWRLVWAAGPSVERIDEVLGSKGPLGPQGVTTAIRRGGGVEALGFAHRTLLDPSSLEAFGDVTIEAVG
jgi:folate-binding protein YgfZ